MAFLVYLGYSLACLSCNLCWASIFNDR